MRSVRIVASPRRPGAPRSVRWLHRPPTDSDGWGTIEIRLGRAVTAYRCRVIPTDFGPEHRGFELHKLGPGQQPTDVVYHVLVDLARGWHRCDCLGHEAHGHCRMHEDPLILVAVIVQLGLDSSQPAPAD